MSLYHYTCRHGFDGIRRDGIVRPNHHPLLGVTVAWFTDLEDPTPEEVGLTSETLSCDRLRYRFTVSDRVGVVPWLFLQPHLDVDPAFFSTFHLAPARPENWFVCGLSVPAVFDRRMVSAS